MATQLYARGQAKAMKQSHYTHESLEPMPPSLLQLGRLQSGLSTGLKLCGQQHVGPPPIYPS